MELACNRCYLAFEVPEIAQKLRKREEICTKYVKNTLGGVEKAKILKPVQCR